MEKRCNCDCHKTRGKKTIPIPKLGQNDRFDLVYQPPVYDSMSPQISNITDISRLDDSKYCYSSGASSSDDSGAADYLSQGVHMHPFNCHCGKCVIAWKLQRLKVEYPTQGYKLKVYQQINGKYVEVDAYEYCGLNKDDGPTYEPDMPERCHTCFCITKTN